MPSHPDRVRRNYEESKPWRSNDAVATFRASFSEDAVRMIFHGPLYSGPDDDTLTGAWPAKPVDEI
jgi:hypothetical protein